MRRLIFWVHEAAWKKNIGNYLLMPRRSQLRQASNAVLGSSMMTVKQFNVLTTAHLRSRNSCWQTPLRRAFWPCRSDRPVAGALRDQHPNLRAGKMDTVVVVVVLGTLLVWHSLCLTVLRQRMKHGAHYDQIEVVKRTQNNVVRSPDDVRASK